MCFFRCFYRRRSFPTDISNLNNDKSPQLSTVQVTPSIITPRNLDENKLTIADHLFLLECIYAHLRSHKARQITSNEFVEVIKFLYLDHIKNYKKNLSSNI